MRAPLSTEAPVLDLDVDAAEALAPSVGRLDEAQRGVVEGDRGIAGGVGRHVDLGDVAPTGGQRGRVGRLQLGDQDGARQIGAHVGLPVASAGAHGPSAVVALQRHLVDLPQRAAGVLGVELDADQVLLGHVEVERDPHAELGGAAPCAGRRRRSGRSPGSRCRRHGAACNGRRRCRPAWE